MGGSAAAAAAFKTCSPHTGIKTTLSLCRMSRVANLAPAFKTCSPHTGIKTSAPHRTGSGRQPPRLSKHVPHTRGLKRRIHAHKARIALLGLSKHVPHTRGLKRGPIPPARRGRDLLPVLSKHVPHTRGLKPRRVRLRCLHVLEVLVAFKTCSPHTGIKTSCLMFGTICKIYLYPITFKTCSPHTGIKTPRSTNPLACWCGRPLQTFKTCSPHTGIKTG